MRPDGHWLVDGGRGLDALVVMAAQIFDPQMEHVLPITIANARARMGAMCQARTTRGKCYAVCKGIRAARLQSGDGSSPASYRLGLITRTEHPKKPHDLGRRVILETTMDRGVSGRRSCDAEEPPPCGIRYFGHEIIRGSSNPELRLFGTQILVNLDTLSHGFFPDPLDIKNDLEPVGPLWFAKRGNRKRAAFQKDRVLAEVKGVLVSNLDALSMRRLCGQQGQK
jgi:hypothetical protein